MPLSSFKHSIIGLFFFGIAMSFICSCDSDRPPIAPAVNLRDSIPVMTTYGVSKVISDSGVIRYKVITEQWSVYDRTVPQKQTFLKGLLLEKFNEKFHIEMYITADTAYWFNQSLWELRGRVCVWQDNGTIFNSEILYWDMNLHEFYSNKYSHFVSPEREVEGNSFHSNEQMTIYEVNFSHAVFPTPEDFNKNSDTTTVVTTDSLHAKNLEEDNKPRKKIFTPAKSLKTKTNILNKPIDS